MIERRSNVTGVSDFVGRQAEVARFEAIGTAVMRERRPAALVILGEPGEGKSRLLDEGVRRSRIPRRARITGFEIERHVPLAGARALLAEASDSSAGAAIRTVLRGSDAPRSEGLETVRVFEALHRYVASLGPLSLVIDDLQWLDEVSLSLAHYLLRAADAEAQPLALFAAGRDETAARSFAVSLQSALPAGRTEILELGPLSAQEGIALAMRLSPGLSQAAATELHLRAGGSPFWLQALARTTSPLPDIATLVSDRMRGVSADAVHLMSLLAVADRPLPGEEVEAILEWPATRAAAATHELVGRGLAVVTGAEIRPAHDLLRSAALMGMPERQRVAMHKRIAAYLERVAGDDVRILSEALEHGRAAGLPDLALALRIARSPRRRLLGQDGTARLAELAESAGGSSDAVALREAVARLGAEVGSVSLAVRLWEGVAAEAVGPEARARAWFEAASLGYLRLGDRERSRSAIAMARRLDPGDAALGIELDALEATFARLVDQDGSKWAELSDRALDRGRRLVESAGGADRLADDARHAWLHALSVAYDGARLIDDDPEAMLSLARDMRAAAGSSDEARFHGEFNTGLALRALGRFDEAQDVLSRVWTEAQRQLIPWWASECGYWLGDVLRTLGRLRESRQVAEQSMLIAGRVEDRRAVSDADWQLCILDLSMGDWREAVAALEAKLVVEPDSHYRLDLHAPIASWLARFGRPADRSTVRTHLEALQADIVAAGCDRCRREFTLRLAETLARVGDVDEAARLLDDWDREVPAPATVAALWRERARAQVLMASAEPVAAAAVLAALVADFERLAMAPDAIWARLDRGSALAGVDRAGAVAAYRAAAHSAESIGADNEARAARRALREMGVRPDTRLGDARQPRVAGLTPSEMEVARRAAAGASNGEIAAQLFISRKTVERHMTRALAKLGVRNRTELAARMASPDHGPSDEKHAGIPG